MSLPKLDLQRTFFEPEILFPGLGKAPGAERFSFFAERILPELRKRRPELDKTKPVVLCCASGARSSVAVGILKGLGFRNVSNAGPWQNT